jgi:omega-amidase
MNSPLFINICQTSIIWESPTLNCERYTKVLDVYYERYGKKESDEIVVFPEFFTTGFTLNKNIAEEKYGFSFQWMVKNAEKYGIAIVGSIPTIENGCIFNRLYFVTPSGESFYYDKRHLFSVGDENKTYTKGSEKRIINYHSWNIALNTCYDLRFPMWERNIDLQYDVMLIVASWPASRIGVTEHLLKARAIENLSYYLFANRVGEDPSNTYDGHSLIVDYKGNSIGREILLDNNTSFIGSKIVKDNLCDFRIKFPVWRDWD